MIEDDDEHDDENDGDDDDDQPVICKQADTLLYKQNGYNPDPVPGRKDPSCRARQ